MFIPILVTWLSSWSWETNNATFHIPGLPIEEYFSMLTTRSLMLKWFWWICLKYILITRSSILACRSIYFPDWTFVWTWEVRRILDVWINSLFVSWLHIIAEAFLRNAHKRFFSKLFLPFCVVEDLNPHLEVEMSCIVKSSNRKETLLTCHSLSKSTNKSDSLFTFKVVLSTFSTSKVYLNKSSVSFIFSTLTIRYSWEE